MKVLSSGVRAHLVVLTMVALAAASQTIAGCSSTESSDPDTTSSATASGGSNQGGSNAGGSSDGGSNNGGSSTGGSSNGGSNSGGSGGGTEAPTAKITAPHDGDSFAANTDIPFTGSASDPQDGALSGNALAWVGDIAGIVNPEGFGVSGNAGFSTAGDHTLTLTATDSDGHTDSQTVTLHITE